MTFFGPLILYVPLQLLRGWVFSLLWGWYVVPAFGLPPLTVIEAIGIGLLVYLLTASYNVDEERPWWSYSAYSAILSLLTLLLGWIWTFQL